MTSDQIKRRILLNSYPMVMSIAMSSFVAGLVFIAFPQVLEGTAVGDTLSAPFEVVWSGAYALGGLGVLLGFWQLNSKYEVAGLLTLGCTYLINGYAVFAVRGVQPGLVSASVFVGLCAGCTWRAWILSGQDG